MRPSAPIYIVSKGRWQRDRRLTSRALERINVPHIMVIEEAEYSAYAEVVNPALVTLLVLDPAYQRDYDTCDDLGDSKSKGPGPARNFVWDHAQSNNHAWHWILDDNIQAFYRLHQNAKIMVLDGAFFQAMQDFCDRYSSVVMAGPNYEHFALRAQRKAPFQLNTRIYSCNLIQTSAPFRWRGRYNEDTILSLDMLKAGYCTVLFNAFLINKVATQRIAGGNTDEFYIREGTLAKSRMQVQVHPDVSRLVWKWNRWHHHVDYRRFRKNQLIRKSGIEIPTEPNEYGMRLVNLAERASDAMAAD
jgi:hypothetical protein